MRIPTVAIVGKPNVGKSSLFNRLIRKRKAIVAEEPGVTRDINYEDLVIGQLRCRIADSAGYAPGREGIIVRTRELNRKLIAEASLIIFVCDIAGIERGDHDVAEVIRKSGKPSILVVNKADKNNYKDNIYDFFELGLGEPIALSAMHGRNVEMLLDRIGEYIDRENKLAPSERFPCIPVAIVGKPNVGKSSLLNMLTDSERSLVHCEPGTTRDAVDDTFDYGGYTFKLTDTAGIRRQGKMDNIEFYSLTRTRKAVKDSSVALLVLESPKGITNLDKKIASIIATEQRGLVIVANKWDLMPEGSSSEEFSRDLFYYFPHISYAEIVPISAHTGYNKKKLLKNIIKVYNNYYRQIKTNDLNQVITQLFLRGNRVKYGYQKHFAPPVFEFFIKSAEKSNQNFKKYIGNTLREEFEFTGVPLDIRLRVR